MRMGVFGLGYAGCVSAACLAEAGHRVVGVDINSTKVAAIRAGRSPVLEPGLDRLVARSTRAGRLTATTDSNLAVRASDVVFICVGTPSRRNGEMDLADVAKVSDQIGHALRGRGGRAVVAVRSTVLPGTTETVVVPRLERASGRRAGVDFGVTYNPEFMREGSGIRDFKHASRVVVGASDRRSLSTMRRAYAFLGSPVVATDVRTAEMVKYVDNAFHALKVAFANEIARLCRLQRVETREVIDTFLMDGQLNLSAAYLRPGLPFGGSCLPKDLRALIARGHRLHEGAPLLRGVARSNALHRRFVRRLVEGTGGCRIVVIGLSFKPGTDDLRESPTLDLVKDLLASGLRVRIYDPAVRAGRLVGANAAYARRTLPALASLCARGLDEVVRGSDVVVIGRWDRRIARALGALRADQAVVDLVGIPAPQCGRARYVGLY